MSWIVAVGMAVGGGFVVGGLLVFTIPTFRVTG